uniref:Uncharacterized protein n=1 Tax=Timema douglasi TaxID=61478 RepID=A0A7R8VDH9_TIMDO|nr:unnamed protein product [Timema douglasi]
MSASPIPNTPTVGSEGKSIPLTRLACHWWRARESIIEGPTQHPACVGYGNKREKKRLRDARVDGPAFGNSHFRQRLTTCAEHSCAGPLNFRLLIERRAQRTDLKYIGCSEVDWIELVQDKPPDPMITGHWLEFSVDNKMYASLCQISHFVEILASEEVFLYREDFVEGAMIGVKHTTARRCAAVVYLRLIRLVGASSSLHNTSKYSSSSFSSLEVSVSAGRLAHPLPFLSISPRFSLCSCLRSTPLSSKEILPNLNSGGAMFEGACAVKAHCTVADKGKSTRPHGGFIGLQGYYEHSTQKANNARRAAIAQSSTHRCIRTRMKSVRAAANAIEKQKCVTRNMADKVHLAAATGTQTYREFNKVNGKINFFEVVDTYIVKSHYTKMFAIIILSLQEKVTILCSIQEEKQTLSYTSDFIPGGIRFGECSDAVH